MDETAGELAVLLVCRKCGNREILPVRWLLPISALIPRFIGVMKGFTAGHCHFWPEKRRF
jgi:hypothetical protein